MSEVLGKNGVERVAELELDSYDMVWYDKSQKEIDKTLNLLFLKKV